MSSPGGPSQSAPETPDTTRMEEDTLAVQSTEPGSKQAFVEVFVGGLPPDATDEGVEAAFAAVGHVLSVRLNRRKKTGECKGFGFIRFADQATAERACQEVREACGKPVGVHISRARSLEQALEEEAPATASVSTEASDFETALNKLLRLLRGHSDKQVAVAAALKAALAVPHKLKSNSADRLNEDGRLEEGEGPDEADARLKEEEQLPDPATFLESYPRCKRLVDTFRANPNTHNKTPLAVLHEYATRLSLELMYDESADSNLGPFTVDARLTSVGGSVLYATGEGRGRGKKDAKQVAAAAVLEMLLANVPEQDFLQPGKGKFLRLKQVSPHTVSGSMGRASVPARGRARGRWPAMRPARGSEYTNSMPAYAQAPSNPGYNMSPYAGTGSNPAQELDMYSLPAASPSAAGKVRSFLAGQQQNDVDLLRSLRGHSLDTLQRQLVGLAVSQDAPLGLYGNSRSFDNSGFTFGHTPEQEQAQAVLRNRGGYSNMATLPEGSLLGLGPRGLAPNPSHTGSSPNYQNPLQPFPPY